MLTKTQITTLNNARATLEDVQSKLGVHRDTREFRHGRLAEACDLAEMAISNVLIITKVYEIGDPLTDKDLKVEGGTS